VEKAEAPASVPFDAYDANGDGVLNGAEVMRGPVRFVRPPDITYQDKYQIRLGGKRVELSWVGSMNHSQDSSYIAFPDESVLFLVDFISFHRLPNREMDYELGQFPEWMTAIRNAEKLAAGFKYVVTGHGPVGTVKDITAWREYFEKLRTSGCRGHCEGPDARTDAAGYQDGRVQPMGRLRLGAAQRPGDVPLPDRSEVTERGRACCTEHPFLATPRRKGLFGGALDTALDATPGIGP
jgi:glyoxylase-like metal-dependent hydrolase (beta-lactamase superfamily II)